MDNQTNMSLGLPPLEIWATMVGNIVAKSKEYAEGLQEVVKQEIYVIEVHKQKAREALGKDEHEFKYRMYMAKETVFNLRYIGSRMNFFDACSELDTPNILKFHQECIDFENEAVETVCNSENQILSVNAITNETHQGEGATLKICETMKKALEGREAFLKMIDMFEKGRDLYEPQIMSALSQCDK